MSLREQQAVSTADSVDQASTHHTTLHAFQLRVHLRRPTMSERVVASLVILKVHRITPTKAAVVVFVWGHAQQQTGLPHLEEIDQQQRVVG